MAEAKQEQKVAHKEWLKQNKNMVQDVVGQPNSARYLLAFLLFFQPFVQNICQNFEASFVEVHFRSGHEWIVLSQLI